jgi:uncharacterized SAM-binding protein YcdF (DUF218 family)
MKCVAVLSHLMSNDCILSAESVARAELAINAFTNSEYSFLITTGWAYRSDSDAAISDVVKDYILNHSEIDTDKIISSPFARDTVGDAFFCLKLVKLKRISKILVVTSDYHVERTKKIFKRFFQSGAKVEVKGARTEGGKDPEILDHEVNSLKVFEKTFANTNFKDIRKIYECISTKHPFYNGDKFSKIAFE